MNYWITTDTHFGHIKLVLDGARTSTFEDKILKGFLILQPDDVLIHLGDVSFKNDNFYHSMITKISPCKKWLIRGNHDNHSDTWYFKHGWDFVADQIRFKRFGANIVFSHIPIKDDGYDLNIHGHFHNSEHRKNEPEVLAIANSKQILVALETTNYRPVLLKRLVRRNMRV